MKRRENIFITDKPKSTDEILGEVKWDKAHKRHGWVFKVPIFLGPEVFSRIISILKAADKQRAAMRASK